MVLLCIAFLHKILGGIIFVLFFMIDSIDLCVLWNYFSLMRRGLTKAFHALAHQIGITGYLPRFKVCKASVFGLVIIIMIMIIGVFIRRTL